MSKRWSVSPIGWVLLGVAVLGLLALFLGSRGLEVAGFVVLLIVVLLALADRMSIATGRMGLMSMPWMRPRDFPGNAIEPDYIPKAGTPSAEAWANEQELYRRKHQDEPER